jgi:hypothetical protein
MVLSGEDGMIDKKYLTIFKTLKANIWVDKGWLVATDKAALLAIANPFDITDGEYALKTGTKINDSPDIPKWRNLFTDGKYSAITESIETIEALYESCKQFDIIVNTGKIWNTLKHTAIKGMLVKGKRVPVIFRGDFDKSPLLYAIAQLAPCDKYVPEEVTVTDMFKEEGV